MGKDSPGMWTAEKQQRLDTLRERVDNGTITEPEGEELTALLSEITQLEATSLAPAIERLSAARQQMQYELDVTEGRNATLAALIERQVSVLERARRELCVLIAEHEHILREAERALGRPLAT